MKEIKLFKKGDLIVIALILLLSVLLLIPTFFKNDRLTAMVLVEGKISEIIELDKVDKPYTIKPNDSTVIKVEKGRICFSEACCKDRLCVKSGWLDKNGQTAACLPQKIVISIKGGSNSTDMLTY